MPNWLRQKPQKIDKPEEPPPGKPEFDDAPKFGTNIDRPVIDLYRPHITSGDCLIVTGYQDFLSSLAVLMREVKKLKDPDTKADIHIRISFGVDTANARRLAKPRPVTEEMKLYWLERSGLQVEDDHDLLAVLAKRAIQTRKIELRVAMLGIDAMAAPEKC